MIVLSFPQPVWPPADHCKVTHAHPELPADRPGATQTGRLILSLYLQDYLRCTRTDRSTATQARPAFPANRSEATQTGELASNDPSCEGYLMSQLHPRCHSYLHILIRTLPW